MISIVLFMGNGRLKLNKSRRIDLKYVKKLAAKMIIKKNNCFLKCFEIQSNFNKCVSRVGDINIMHLLSFITQNTHARGAKWQLSDLYSAPSS